MDFKTKVITTVIAMVCSLSVSATGIVAILLQFPVEVANITTIEASMVNGNLVGKRLGAGLRDLDLTLLYKSGEGIQEESMNAFETDVNFAPGSKTMEYIFGFSLNKDATTGVFITLEHASIDNTDLYEASYSYAYSDAEPDWSTAENISVGTHYTVTKDNPYIWLRATLSIKDSGYSRLGTSGTWSFKFTFDGVTQSD